MKSKELCKKIAREIRRGYFNAGEYSGFSAIGEESVSERLAELVDAVKKETIKEIQELYKSK